MENKSNLITPKWNIPSNVKCLITTRNGGISTGNFASFNLATHVGDNIDYVNYNRKLLLSHVSNEPLWLKQTHSTNVLNLINKKLDFQELSTKEYDAIIINQRSQVATVMTADCVPVLLTDINGSFVSAIHAGWRGLLDGIIEATINQIKIEKKDILVYIGPTICQKHFIVGLDLYEQFVSQNISYQQYFSVVNYKFKFDLVGMSRLKLNTLGIPINNITSSKLCTYCEKDIFYSYRREGITGRIASLIWLNT